MNDQVQINIRMGLATCGHWKLEDLPAVYEFVVGPEKKQSSIIPVSKFEVVQK